jgi:hypothetical protein
MSRPRVVIHNHYSRPARDVVDVMGSGKKVKVVKNGQVIGEVSQTATSVAASKIAGGPCELAKHEGEYVWRAK